MKKIEKETQDIKKRTPVKKQKVPVAVVKIVYNSLFRLQIKEQSPPAKERKKDDKK